MAKAIWTTLREGLSLLRIFDDTGSFIATLSEFMFDLLNVKTCEHLSRTFTRTALTEQHAQEVAEELRDSFLRVKAGQFSRPDRVSSHSPAQEQTEPQRLAQDRVCRTDSDTLAARQTGLRAMDGSAVFHEHRGFPAGRLAQAAPCAGSGNFSGAKRGDEADVLDLRLRAAVRAG